MHLFLSLIIFLFLSGCTSLSTNISSNKAVDNPTNSEKTKQIELDDGSTLIKYFDDNGNLKAEAIYKNNLLNGISKSYYDNGMIYQEISFKNGETNGLSKTYNNDNESMLLKEANYIDGKLNGLVKEYGTQEYGEMTIVLMSELNYIDDIKIGTQKQYFDSGELKELCKISKDPENNELSICSTYWGLSGRGVPKETCEYLNGKKHGKCQEHYFDGSNGNFCEYLDGKKNGKCTSSEFINFEGQKLYYRYIDTYTDDVLVNRKTYDRTGMLTADNNFEH